MCRIRIFGCVEYTGGEVMLRDFILSALEAFGVGLLMVGFFGALLVIAEALGL